MWASERAWYWVVERGVGSLAGGGVGVGEVVVERRR